MSEKKINFTNLNQFEKTKREAGDRNEADIYDIEESPQEEEFKEEFGKEKDKFLPESWERKKFRKEKDKFPESWKAEERPDLVKKVLILNYIRYFFADKDLENKIAQAKGLLRRMESWDPTKCAPFLTEVKDFCLSKYSIQKDDYVYLLLEKVDWQAVGRLPLKDKIYFWLIKGELEEKLDEELPNGWDPESNPELKEELIRFISESFGNGKDQYDNGRVADILLGKMRSWDPNKNPILKQEMIRSLVKKRFLMCDFSNSLFEKMENYDPIEHKDIKKLVLNGELPRLAEKADFKAIEKLSLGEKVCFWYHRGELKEKLEKEYSDGWSLEECPNFLKLIEKNKDTYFTETFLGKLKEWSVKDGASKPLKEIIENREETEKVRYLLLKKMAPCYLKDFMALKEILKEESLIYSLSYIAAEKIISLSADDFPILLELLKDKNVQQEKIDKCLAEKVETWNADENKEMVEFVLDKKNRYGVREIIINKINEKSIEKLPLKEKIYLWNYRGELSDKINEDFINNLSQEDVKELNRIIEEEGEESYIYNIFKKWAKEIYSNSPFRSPFYK